MNVMNQIEGKLQKNVVEYLIKFCPEEQKQINEEDAENALIYGIQCYIIKLNNKFYNCEICLSYKDDNVINIYNKDKSKIKNINIERIDNIIIRHLEKISQFYNFDVNYNYICEILVKRIGYNIFFKERKDLLLFVKGLLLISQKNIETFDSHVDIHVDKFNTNFNEELENDELKNLADYLGFGYPLLKKQIDMNKDNMVSIQEFKDFIKKKMSGEQFRPIFEKYSTLIYNNTERVMGPIDLQNFFKECQKDEISYLEACQIIIEFNSIKDNKIKNNCIQSFEDLLLSNKSFNNKDIESILAFHNKDIISNQAQNNQDQCETLKLFLTLYEFNMMLHSLLLTVYDKKKFNQRLDIDHPLTNYFISSSHNTYIVGHQLIGKSSSKMYSTSLLYNFRMVELDCYEGEGDEIIITHGYTLVDDLTLDEILIELKETAFINSDLPVILSIENHLGEKYQQIMVDKLKNILKDLYIFPQNFKPDYLPNLRDLKKKFLIKCGGRKLWEDANIPAKKHINQVYNLNNNFLLTQILNPSYQLIEKKIIFLDQIKQTKTKRNTTILHKIKRTKSLHYNNKQIEENIIIGLEKILGLIGMKFKSDQVTTNYYKPWEMITIKCSKATKFADNFVDKINITNLTKHCLLRIYPEKFDSTNYNIIKCFSCGIQGCCLNIQATKDDFTLYNKIFFKQNEGLGYVLKPERFLSQEFNSYYDRVSYICKIQIVSLFNLSKLIEEENIDIKYDNNLSLSIYVIGTKEDESNPKFDFKLINGSLFPSFQDGNPEVEFKVYDYDLSAIMIKIKSNDNLIGRSCIPYSLMKLGYRRIPIYDNQCFNVKEAYMVGYFTLNKI